MAIVAGLFSMFGRFAGRLLNSVLGWATILLFGKVEGRKQTVLLLIALGSLAWVAVVVGVIVPSVGTFLIAFVPVPAFVDDNLVRLAMLALAVLLPLAIGVAAVYVTEPSARPRGWGLVTAVLRGYPFTLVLAITIAVLGAVALVRKVRSLSKRWEDAHVPLIVKPGGYDAVVRDLVEVLEGAGLEAQARAAPAVLSLPPRLLDRVAGKAFGALVPDRLMLLKASDLEILVYPSDVGIAGTKEAVARSRAAIAAKLVESPAYMTTSAESEKVEDEIRRLAEMVARSTPGGPTQALIRSRLRALDARIATLIVPFDEWETIYRERLQVEARLNERAGITGLGDTQRLEVEATEPPSTRVIGLVSVALMLADVALLIAERLRPARRA